MGAQLARAATQAHWARTLPMPARVLLTHMALTAYDRDTEKIAARRYFGGYEGLVLALTGESRDDLDPEDWARASDRVKKAVRTLITAGAITRIQVAEGGSRAVYEVHPDRFEGQ